MKILKDGKQIKTHLHAALGTASCQHGLEVYCLW